MPPRPPSLARAPLSESRRNQSSGKDNEAAACHAPRRHWETGAGAKSARRFGGAESCAARRRRRRRRKTTKAGSRHAEGPDAACAGPGSSALATGTPKEILKLQRLFPRRRRRRLRLLDPRRKGRALGGGSQALCLWEFGGPNHAPSLVCLLNLNRAYAPKHGLDTGEGMGSD